MTKMLLNYVLPTLMMLSAAMAISKCFGKNKVRICNDDYTKCRCEDCPVCEPGKGLNQECIGTLSDRVTLMCVPCISGETYSANNNTGSCEPCERCEGHVMESPCNFTSPTKCSRTECRDGYEYNSMVENCDPVPVTTKLTSPTTGPTTQTTNLVTSRAKQLSTQAPDSTPNPLMSSTLGPTTINPVNKDDSNDRTPRPKSSADNHEKHLEDIKNKQNILIVIVVVSVFAVAGFATTIFACKERIRQCCASQTEEGHQEETIPLGEIEQESPPTSHKDVASKKVYTFPWAYDYLLKELPDEIQNIITTAIASPETGIKGWKEIGNKLHVQPNSLKGVGNFLPQERGIQLLKVLSANQPSLTVSQFMDVCAEVGRDDIVEDVIKEYNKVNKQNDTLDIIDECGQEIPEKNDSSM